MYDIRSAMLNIGIVFTPGKFKINLEKTWKTPGILVNLRSTDPGIWNYISTKISIDVSYASFKHSSKLFIKNNPIPYRVT